LVEAACKKWLKNENDLGDDKYELPIKKYDANQEALIEQKEGAWWRRKGSPNAITINFKKRYLIFHKDL
jgi:hypothetical protein